LPYPPLEQNRSLSLSLSLGVYRAGKGKGNFELAAAGVPNEFAAGGQFGQGRADGGGAKATEFLQLLDI
jgi:hypothetical protein